MAKKSMIAKAERPRSSTCRRTTAAPCAAGRAPSCAASTCAASASGSAPSWASCRASRSRAGRPMNISDPIADMLTRVRNASRARHTEVVVPASRTKREIARILKDEGFIAEVDRGAGRASRGPAPPAASTSTARCRSCPASSGSASPACACTRRKTDIPRVLGGLGIVIVSTSQGIMTGAQARKAQLGGEVLAYVW